MIRIEHNAETNTITEIELTPAEVKQYEEMYRESVAKSKILEAEAEAKATEKQALLNRLGITADEAKLLLG